MLHQDDISLVFGGAAGQGIQTIADALVTVLKNNGYAVFSCQEFMSRVRGGSNSSQIRITSERRNAYVRKIDLLFVLDAEALDHLRWRIGEGTTIFAEHDQLGEEDRGRVIDTPLKEFAQKAGHPVYTNSVAVGAVLGVLGLGLEEFNDYLSREFESKGEEVVGRNHDAARLGYEFGVKSAREHHIDITLPTAAEDPASLLLDGTSGLGIGALMAGCGVVSSYPMSPSTGLLTFLAARGRRFGIVVDQAEDEIAAVNAALGASYAGARSLVTTSGGGFALMSEGVSLAGVTELPLVIHIGQRPGPATGLPTRTEQGDLNLALHAGHGDFCRVLLAPGTPAQAIELMQRAFDIAESYQVPVFVLTDQFMLDSVSMLGDEEIVRLPLQRRVVKTGSDYERYRFTDDGISPRGVPGYGEGIVKVDSHEHDESGHLTENFTIRRKMVGKRLQRLGSLEQEAVPPERIGSDDAAALVVCWGSTRGVVEEALDILQDDNIAALHFSQVFPLHTGLGGMLEGKQVIVLENNATGQFADLLHAVTGRQADRRILKATGEPFAVEEVVEALKGGVAS
ncbi:2-oxoacid:acceptor oxidoreductase subunit alpha [Prosthecochloris sp. N3]|uniref:2-oxoacid:acceptor oxidoreductase subunit alpha n=1 Tax=Prosthecochloris ethylica TaxID=2743976 RepID=A0ABR9XQK3_9CHLB|nr:2-oxoacid:acceptor oxidoreductase subunit alpha [Prosthecochloris ethylica]MBF0585452.1 2-oxoacid:acceptor oxidoreductase subunit alpha [Prosthecochloris ethylica]MBF0636238.1 2-oxoacid:acceptor oxidoreductase subunit alpha [Prosthecochloris ethylica]NUK46682.1 2-oxoacid:acceptor oxidoreductase subunit alpha [Prosthecochloris ethylica]